MLRNPLHALAALAALATGALLTIGAATAQEPCYGGNCGYGYNPHYCPKYTMHGQTPIDGRDLFYNYYVGPANCPSSGGTGANAVAAMYPSPLPVPPLVGHTYITYQPLLPHEFLYAHHHNYQSIQPDGARVTTRVHYGTSVAGHWNPWFGNRAPRPRGPEYLRDPLRR